MAGRGSPARMKRRTNLTATSCPAASTSRTPCSDQDKRQSSVFYNLVKSRSDKLQRLTFQVEKYQQDELHLAERVSATDSTSDASLGEFEESIMTRLDQVIDDIDSHFKRMCPNIIEDVGPPAAKIRKENSTIAEVLECVKAEIVTSVSECKSVRHLVVVLLRLIHIIEKDDVTQVTIDIVKAMAEEMKGHKSAMWDLYRTWDNYVAELKTKIQEKLSKAKSPTDLRNSLKACYQHLRKDNRSLILQDYDSSGWFATKQALRDSLHRRFKDVKILVDSNARKVCFQKLSREGSLQAERKYDFSEHVAQQDDNFLPQPEYHIKWRNPCPESSAALEFVKGHFAETTRYLYADQKEEWKLTYLDPVKPVAPVSQETVRRFEENLNIMGLGYFDVAVPQFPSLFHAAFVNNLCDSVGREGVVALLEYACKVAFGYDCLQRNVVNIGSVGASPYPPEEFPVVKAVSSQQGEKVSKLRSLSEIKPLYQEEEGYGGHTSATYVSPSSGESWKSCKFIYPDIVVSTADESHWCKYLLICEIKSGSGPVTDAEHSQLIQQLTATCMHQTEVFGMIIKSQSCRLVRIEHDSFTSKFHVRRLDLGSFLIAAHRQTYHYQFSLRALNNLFLHLVELLDYGKTEIEKVEVRL